jgi:hypothetical protein
LACYTAIKALLFRNGAGGISMNTMQPAMKISARPARHEKKDMIARLRTARNDVDALLARSIREDGRDGAIRQKELQGMRKDILDMQAGLGLFGLRTPSDCGTKLQSIEERIEFVNSVPAGFPASSGTPIPEGIVKTLGGKKK